MTMIQRFKTCIGVVVFLLAGSFTAAAEDENPGTFTIPDIKFDEQQKTEVQVYFQSEIEGYNGLMMDFWMPAEYTVESDAYGYIYDVNSRFVRGYSFVIADRTHETDPSLVEEGKHFYRFVGFAGNPIPHPCNGLFFSFPIDGPTENPATEDVVVRVTNIEFSPSQGDNPAYLNTFPDMEFSIEPYQQTGVEKVSVAPAGNGLIYDTQGRCLGTDRSNLRPGIYIIDGTKVLVR